MPEKYPHKINIPENDAIISAIPDGDSCLGHGTRQNGKCKCDKNFIGDQCHREGNKLRKPIAVNYEKGEAYKRKFLRVVM